MIWCWQCMCFLHVPIFVLARTSRRQVLTAWSTLARQAFFYEVSSRNYIPRLPWMWSCFLSATSNVEEDWLKLPSFLITEFVSRPECLIRILRRILFFQEILKNWTHASEHAGATGILIFRAAFFFFVKAKIIFQGWDGGGGKNQFVKAH